MSEEQQFDERLTRMEATLQEIAATPSLEAKESGATTLMADFFDLGVALARQPELRESSYFLRFFETTLGNVVDATTGIEIYMQTTESRCGDTWYGREWMWICERRSSIQFFLDLYSESEISPVIQLIEIGSLDKAIRYRGQFDGFVKESEIPEGMPSAHWWWWYPEEPPLRS